MSGGRLHPTLPHRMGEAPTSLASRLAQLHIPENASARFFCADMGIDFGGLVQGQPDSVMAFAELAGADPDQLAAEAFRRVPGGHVFRGEVFPKSSLSRTSLRFCSACLFDDCSGAARPETAASGRTIWSVSSIRTCPDHGVGIVEVDQTVRPSQTHDFAQILKPLLPELGKLADQSPRRAPSALERYALDRLAGTVGSAPWLDGLPLHAVLAFCEIIGMVDRFGREVRATKLSESEWFEAGGSGFSIASRGEIGVREFMDDLIRTYPYSGSATEGPQAVLGRLFKFLSFGSPHSDFDVFRDLVADFMIKRMPLGPGDIIFGKPIERRVLHSVHSAAQELQVHPKRLRKVLHAAGVLTTEQLDLANGNAVFDAAAAGPTLSDAVDGLFMTEIEPYLGTGRVQTKLLVDAGIVEPMFPKRPDLDHLFRRRDLDAFLERLFVGAVPIDAPDDDMVDVQKAVKRVCCRTVDVVRLVLDRKLGFVGRQTDKHGFSALLVSVAEVRSLMRGSMEGWLTAETIGTTMRTNWAVVRKLINRGILPVETIVSPLNRCPVKVIPQAAFDEFRREYTTLFEAMETTGIHFRRIQKRLTALGIEPEIRREDVGAAFYRRSDLLRI